MASSQEPTEALGEATKLLDSGNRIKALEIVSGFLKQHRDNAEAWYLLGILKDDVAEQTSALERALYYDPAHVKARQRLRTLQRKSQNRTKAVVVSIIVILVILAWIALGYAISPPRLIDTVTPAPRNTSTVPTPTQESLPGAMNVPAGFALKV